MQHAEIVERAKRSKGIQVRVTPEVLALLQREAYASNRSLSAYASLFFQRHYELKREADRKREEELLP